MWISTGKYDTTNCRRRRLRFRPFSVQYFINALILDPSFSLCYSIFDKGLNLPRPEVVPFRLTPNMLDAFGPTGADGMFSSGMECSLEILRGNQDTLLSVLEPFIKDPIIDWRKHRSQQNVLPSSKMPSDSHGEAKRSISVIKERLSGICNLRNPNYRKLRNVIPREELSRVEQDNMMIGILPLSVEGQVQKLCAEASKNENLVQLYVGWMPWV